ncbi:MAG: SGNH/GDSL hydrolase family protein [Clostridiales bacterium]|nr:SGNH/GDSL hydrolase family protein [Clostridiales bacterium]
MFEKNAVILFQGDSITDVGRSREDDKKLGKGYPSIVKKQIDDMCPELGIRVVNRGISGNRAIDLVSRWQEDCIDLNPDYVSILIGVNDTWRRYDRNDPTSDSDYKERYRFIIEETLKKTQAKILLMNPFLLEVSQKVTQMRDDLKGKQRAVKELADEYNLNFLDLDFAFKVASLFKNSTYFSQDGVHPTKNGHKLIAKLWLEAWDE